jgi:hypothetical protein
MTGFLGCSGALLINRTSLSALEYPLNWLASDLLFWPFQSLFLMLSIASLAIAAGGIICIYGDIKAKGF